MKIVNHIICCLCVMRLFFFFFFFHSLFKWHFLFWFCFQTVFHHNTLLLRRGENPFYWTFDYIFPDYLLYVLKVFFVCCNFFLFVCCNFYGSNLYCVALLFAQYKIKTTTTTTPPPKKKKKITPKKTDGDELLSVVAFIIICYAMLHIQYIYISININVSLLVALL